MMNVRLSPLVVAISVLAFLVMAYGGAWYYAAHALDRALGEWIGAAEDNGWTVAIDREFPTGFPGRLRAPMGGVQIKRGAIRLDLHSAAIMAAPWSPLKPSVTISGAWSLRASGARAWSGVIDRMTIVADFERAGDGRSVTLSANGVSVVGAKTDAPVWIETLEATARAASAADQPGTPVYEAVASARAITLPARIAAGMGGTINALDAKARLLGPVAGEGPLPDRLFIWRENGGAVEIESLAVDWPPVTAHMAGVVKLDARLQPAGSVSARVRGFFRALDRLEAASVVRSRDASMARVVLGLMAEPGADGRAVLTVPLSLRNSRLYLGPAPLVEMPEIPWGADRIPAAPARPPVPPVRLQSGSDVMPDILQ